MLFRTLRPALSLLILLTLLTGLAYPLLITAVAQVAFPVAANGSAIADKTAVTGSALIGQAFAEPGHFWGRPSATTPQPYNGLASGGSNLGPNNPALLDAIRVRAATLRAADPAQQAPIPVDLVTASASGLDPDISPAAARWQIGRVARVRQISPAALTALIEQHIVPRFWGLLGEPHVNVLALNLDLDQRFPVAGTPAPAVR